jgi:hypothetical protein
VNADDSVEHRRILPELLVQVWQRFDGPSRIGVVGTGLWHRNDNS